jgi:hypothetical protein
MLPGPKNSKSPIHRTGIMIDVDIVSSPASARQIPATMSGVVLVGHGGFGKLEFRTDLQVLIKVAAAAINNTDINTRTGWYSKAVRDGTSEGGGTGFASTKEDDASWTGEALNFPRIQGADCCSYIIAVGKGVDPARIGERVIVRNLLRTYVDYRPWECWTFGSECDGAFAQYTKAPSCETFSVDCDWSDIELATLPCAYSTAEGMLHRANVAAGETVVITGASGGVGSSAVQLAKRRGRLSSPSRAKAWFARWALTASSPGARACSTRWARNLSTLSSTSQAWRTLCGCGRNRRTDCRARRPHTLFEGPLLIHR